MPTEKNGDVFLSRWDLFFWKVGSPPKRGVQKKNEKCWQTWSKRPFWEQKAYFLGANLLLVLGRLPQKWLWCLKIYKKYLMNWKFTSSPIPNHPKYRRQTRPSCFSAPQDVEPLYIHKREGINGEGPTTGSGQHDAGKNDVVPVAGEQSWQEIVTKKVRMMNDGSEMLLKKIRLPQKNFAGLKCRSFSEPYFCWCLPFFSFFVHHAYVRSLISQKTQTFPGLIPELVPGILLNPLHCLIGRTWNCWKKYLPSLTLTWHLKMDGWNTIVSFWDGLFSGARLVSGRVKVYLAILRFCALFGMVSENVTRTQKAKSESSDLQSSGIKFGHGLKHLVWIWV